MLSVAGCKGATTTFRTSLNRLNPRSRRPLLLFQHHCLFARPTIHLSSVQSLDTDRGVLAFAL
jgi:hypothetical protein